MGISDGYVAFFVIASLSITMTAVACMLILREGDLRFNVPKLLLSIFATLLLQEIFTLPYVYSWDTSFCGLAAVIHTYTGVANSIATGSLMMYFHCSHTCNERVPLVVSDFIRDWSRLSIFVFPLITFLPFTTNSFGRDDGVWCRIQSDSPIGKVWNLFAYNFWIVSIMLISVVMISRSILAASKIHILIGGKLFSSIGSYSIVALVIWLFRSVVNFSMFFTSEQASKLLYTSELLIHVMGILFSVILFVDMSITDMRTGSEVFNKSSIMSASIVNWEALMRGSVQSESNKHRIDDVVMTPL